MCNRYHPTRADIILAQWNFGVPITGDKTWRPAIGPYGTGPFVRIKETEPELVVGTWALIGGLVRAILGRRQRKFVGEVRDVPSFKPVCGVQGLKRRNTAASSTAFAALRPAAN